MGLRNPSGMIRALMRILGAGCLVLLACRREVTTTVTQDAQAELASTSAPSMTASAPTSKTPSALEVVNRWNDAHVKHDSHALESLYSVKVEFYGQTLTGRACAAKKAAAFAKSPSYRQSIEDVHIDSEGAVTTVTFTKTSIENGKSTDYPAALVVTGGLITAETDMITQANLAAQAAKTQMWCLEEPWIANDKIIAPYKISAKNAYTRARRTKHFHDMEAVRPNVFLDFGQISCPTQCASATRECGYDMRLENHSQDLNSEPHSNLIEWVYVDAVTALMYWDDGAQSEPLPL
jgi:hypothetical protein